MIKICTYTSVDFLSQSRIAFPEEWNGDDEKKIFQRQKQSQYRSKEYVRVFWHFDVFISFDDYFLPHVPVKNNQKFCDDADIYLAYIYVWVEILLNNEYNSTHLTQLTCVT